VNSIGTNAIRMLPPLVCTTAEIDTLIAALYEVLDDVTREVSGR
jgi:4-aminobutyrate aminotransferase-like enzyme